MYGILYSDTGIAFHTLKFYAIVLYNSWYTA
jgi:hypothetical protein